MSPPLKTKDLPFWLALLACLTPFVSSPVALITGFILASLGLVPGNVSLVSFTKQLLTYSIIGLGFGIHFEQALAVTSSGIGLILASIVGTLVTGWFLASVMKLDIVTGYLISTGTAICGGSAIAAVAPAIKAENDQI